MIVNARMDGVEKHSSKTRVEQIKIPSSLILPNLKYCGIITDTYFLHVNKYIIRCYYMGIVLIN